MRELRTPLLECSFSAHESNTLRDALETTSLVPELWRESASRIGAALPTAIRAALKKLSARGAVGVVIRGLPIDESLADTPCHWEDAPWDRYDVLTLALSAHLGSPFGWPTLQGGSPVQDVLPIRGHEDAQSSHASRTELWWHTEDAFKRRPPDSLGLVALRNPDDVATTLAQAPLERLSRDRLDAMRRPRFKISPDPVHIETHADVALQEGLLGEPAPMPLLYHAFGGESLRIDPYFTQVCEEDAEAAAVYDCLTKMINGELESIVLRAGDALFLDNGRVVHGRAAFRARYDGQDRWLKKVTVRQVEGDSAS